MLTGFFQFALHSAFIILRSIPEPPRAVIAGDPGPFRDSVYVTIQRPPHHRGGGLRFTTDGSDPTADSPVYDGPVLVSQPTMVKARLFTEAGVGGPVMARWVDVHDTTPPAVRFARRVSGLPQVTVAFSELVTRDSAEALTHYRFDPPVAASAAQLQGDGTTVMLDLPPDAVVNRLTVVGVCDVSSAGNEMKPTTVAVGVVQPVFHLDAFTATAAPLDRKIAGLPTRSTDPWTITCDVRPDATTDGRVMIAGFGRCQEDRFGGGRYLCAFGGRVHYWSRFQDIDTDQPLVAGRWQSLAATWDGRTLTTYADGVTVGTADLSLSADDEPIVHLTPVSPWDHRSRFAGSLRDVDVWPVALPPRTVQRLAATAPR